MRTAVIGLVVLSGLCSGCVSMKNTNTGGKSLPIVILHKTEGYARLAHPQIELQKDTYVFSCLLTDERQFAPAAGDKVPELWNTGFGTRKETYERQADGWVRYSCLIDVEKDGTYEPMVSIYTFEEVRFAQLSLKRAVGGNELLKNGSFEAGATPWEARGGTIEWIQKSRPTPQPPKATN